VRHFGAGEKPVRGMFSTTFDVLQASSTYLGYMLEESVRDRAGYPIERSMESPIAKREKGFEPGRW